MGSKSKAAGPTAAQKFCEALKSKSHFGKGLSRQYIYKWIGDHYPGTSLAAVRRAVTKCIAEGYIAHGVTNARFKLTKEGTAKFFAPKKKTPKKKKKKTVKKKKSKKKTSKKKKKTVKKGKKKASAKKSPKKQTSEKSKKGKSSKKAAKKNKKASKKKGKKKSGKK